MRSRRLAGVAAVAALAAAHGSAQSPPQASLPTFQSRVTYVELDVTVAGPDGAFVRGLGRDDFEVFEDDRPQAIESFAVVDLPAERAAASAGTAPLSVEPDVRSNERPFAGRVWLLALDALNTAFDRSINVRQIARQFVERVLGPDDLMAIVTLGDAQGAYQALTGDMRLLLPSIDAFVGERLAPMEVPEPTTADDTSPDGRRLPGSGDRTAMVGSVEIERQQRSLNALRKLRTVADWAASVRGRRKALVWLSEGIDYNITTLFSTDRVDAVGVGGSSVALQMHDTAGVISRADVSIYAIDTAGLTVESTIKDFGRWLGQTNMQLMAESTGGFALTNSNNYADAFDRIARESSAYYVLTYSPSESSQRDGKYHRIRVRVKRPGVTARTREGYLAPRDAPDPEAVFVPVDGLSPELEAVLQSPIPISGLPLRASVAPFKGEGTRASVLLAGEIPAPAFSSNRDARLEVSYAAIDGAPAVSVSSTLSTVLAVDAPARVQAEQQGLGFHRRLDLAPGRYQLRIGARDALRGVVGSLLLDVEVPDFSTEPLAMSGLVLGVPSRSAQPLLSADEALAAELGAPVLVDRRFTRADREVVAYVEVYDREPGAHDVAITTTLVAADGREVFEESDTRRSQDAAADGGTHRYSVQVPLDEVVPGEYLLTVTAVSRAADPRTVERRVPFTVIGETAPR